MAEVTEILRPDDSNWGTWLDRAPHDFYHCAAYHTFAERMGEGHAQLLVYGTAQQFLAWPYLLTSIDESEQVDANSVYGYSGPIGVGLEDSDFCVRAWKAMLAVWAEQRLVSLFTRFHPILGSHAYCEDMHGVVAPHGEELLCLGRSVSIDLSRSRDERRSAYPKILRQEIQAAERAGLGVEYDERWAHYATFAELYRTTMRKNNANERYLFSPQYFEGLRAALGNDGHLLVAHKNGEVAATLLFTVRGQIAQAHLTGVNPLFHALSPLKLLLDELAEIARGLGARLLHLGAGRGGKEDSLYKFKSRFSLLRHDFVVGRWVLDAEAYRALVDARYVQTANNTGFFPEYRCPHPSSETEE
ncbi:MAG: GNAT family N-acetyltransferase [Pseudomonadales bacterium]